MTPLKESQPTSVTEILQSWSASLWKSWRDAEKNIRTKVRDEFMPADLNLLPKDQRKKIEEWCDQVPVTGFNSGTYDLNLIKNYFAERLTDTTNKVRVAKNGNKIMFLLTSGFRFLDIINYLGPGTSYEKWVKAYECKTVKS